MKFLKLNELQKAKCDLKLWNSNYVIQGVTMHDSNISKYSSYITPSSFYCREGGYSTQGPIENIAVIITATSGNKYMWILPRIDTATLQTFTNKAVRGYFYHNNKYASIDGDTLEDAFDNAISQKFDYYESKDSSTSNYVNIGDYTYICMEFLYGSDRSLFFELTDTSRFSDFGICLQGITQFLLITDTDNIFESNISSFLLNPSMQKSFLEKYMDGIIFTDEIDEHGNVPSPSEYNLYSKVKTISNHIQTNLMGGIGCDDISKFVIKFKNSILNQEYYTLASSEAEFKFKYSEYNLQNVEEAIYELTTSEEVIETITKSKELSDSIFLNSSNYFIDITKGFLIANFITFHNILNNPVIKIEASDSINIDIFESDFEIVEIETTVDLVNDRNALLNKNFSVPEGLINPPSGDSDGDNNDIAMNPNLFFKLYKVNSTQLASLSSYLWANGSSIADNLKLLGGNPFDALVSLKRIPTALMPELTTESGYITLGNNVSNVEASKITTYHGVKSNIASYFLNPTYNDFRDYAPYTTIKLYLPFTGIIDLSTDLFMNKKLTIDLLISVESGGGKWIIRSNGKKIKEVEFEVGIEYAMTGTNRQTQLSNQFAVKQGKLSNNLSLASGLIGGTSSAARGNYVGAGISGMNTAFSYYENKKALEFKENQIPNSGGYMSTGSSDNNVDMFNTSSICLIIERYEYSIPDNYAHLNGWMYNKYDHLSNGLNIVSEIDLSDNVITEEEKNELENMLGSGVYLL